MIENFRVHFGSLGDELSSYRATEVTENCFLSVNQCWL